MSVVAVKIYDDKIKIAADSIAVRYNFKKKNDSVKLAKINNMIIGSVGFSYSKDLFYNYCATRKPKSENQEDILNFMAEFYKWIKDSYNCDSIDNDFIVIFNKKVFYICQLEVKEITDFASIGAGEDFADAAMYLGHSPKEAVKVACDLCCFADGPIVEYEVSLD